MIKDEESIGKYTSHLIHAKIGNSLLCLTPSALEKYKQTVKIDHSAAMEIAQHLRKILTTDKNVLELEEFPIIDDKMYYGGHFMNESSLIFNPEYSDNELDYDNKNLCHIFQIRPFRLKIRLNPTKPVFYTKEKNG